MLWSSCSQTNTGALPRKTLHARNVFHSSVIRMYQKLNATEWICSVSRDDKEKMREAKRIERDARKLIRTREKLEKNKRKMEKAAM